MLEIKEQGHKNALASVAGAAKQEARHEENLRLGEKRDQDMDILFERDRKRPCKTHDERFKGLVALGTVIIVALSGWLTWLTNLIIRK